MLHFILNTMGIYQRDFRKKRVYELIYYFKSHSDHIVEKDSQRAIVRPNHY